MNVSLPRADRAEAFHNVPPPVDDRSLDATLAASFPNGKADYEGLRQYSARHVHKV